MPALHAVAAAVAGCVSGESFEVRDITCLAGACQPGSIFAALPGTRADGHDFIPEALSRGAQAILSERPAPPDFPAAWIQVADARRALGQVAALLHGHPSHHMHVIGVTGTNGKTTTTYLLYEIFRAAYGHAALLGTIEQRMDDDRRPSRLTTPEAPEVQAFLRRAWDSGCRHVAIEVSSIGLDRWRVADMRFAAAIFTNLTQDHLDYHGTMERYFDAKLRLFDGRNGEVPGIAVLNTDDARTPDIITAINGRARIVTYAVHDPGAEVRLARLDVHTRGMALSLHTPRGMLDLATHLVGTPHAYNILAATATALALDVPTDAILAGVTKTVVPGRFEVVEGSDDHLLVAVDYAHTPDALANVTATARELARLRRGRVITVFGCGGDRDRTKRPLMAEAAAQGSDLTILTSDNPRREAPERILDDAEVGLRAVGKPYHRILDRRQAIAFAIQTAQPGDVVVIAGKGHETYQILNHLTIHFDDREEARQALRRLRSDKGTPME
ncbi:UDP-N-acetylmuramoyl-L-alanyl-D-glutamate--2,6-diaminopimelate ligase [Chloracidobacterium aggregatum]|uniref:UDP-N-acetylmuramoyl-L-alanyl-D-glutamate--2,6-diaminopimelate ligase n=1 Tax=Chloracidobacterium sp. N TaxID=2821540 RepID=A0ABX8B3Z7_9BACT|nr:UDP-N-acetylmuramoyl-L-alanyl-D-glutamate--2,6-diaminopimelate ligase [Chloracidobacterium aggregatum]QUV85244.1 UDP-N-acetylmuramoyl-L-alanyl-D-glutamate--2,6-diaminopimelate ligase [Chloracidobacterium sp. 2]QUV88355.1 UDP-N-acetylmuramoyl-L-alanyl-D-glutamate--2,6-diaminopimelate ligase [Chloracidobacterium sp. S]QUV91274.1 UDP-N-acetylmuramoyl-L-alanyl-D-glutamate--2,6-diaminopimelate ligase [Chloracidobacterium sp. A]QUV94455.1 UDP-N-acetylmuramoyl-L-alanyl-D-glutamate--2,6-diaminopimel